MSSAPQARPLVYCVLISGRIGAGKTTTVDALQQRLLELVDEAECVVLSGQYADELKRECAERAKKPLALFYSEAGKQTLIESEGVTAGRFLQIVGEEARARDPLHWIKALKRKQNEAAADGRRVIMIVGDCRHPNEIDEMRPGVAVLLRGDPGGVRARSTRDLNHISETSLDGYERFDLVLDTDALRTDSVVEAIVARLRLDGVLAQ